MSPQSAPKHDVRFFLHSVYIELVNLRTGDTQVLNEFHFYITLTINTVSKFSWYLIMSPLFNHQVMSRASKTG